MSSPTSTKTVERQSQRQDERYSSEQYCQLGPTGSYADTLSLQRAVGNQTFSQLLQSYAGDSSMSKGDGAPPIVHSVLNARAGRPMDPTTRSAMESRFGYDFGQVRLHSDAQAAESAKAVSAKAYTVGDDVVFGAGRYAPGTSEGKWLLAHELAHVVQQRGLARSGNLTIGATGTGFEREAAQAADNITTGRQIGPLSQASASVIQREPDDSVRNVVAQKIINSAFSSVGLDSTQQRLLIAVGRGVGEELVDQLGKGGKGALLLTRLGAFSAKDAPELIGGYTIGAVEGMVSPITDLFSLAVLGEQLQALAQNLLLGAIARREELATEAQDLVQAGIQGVREGVKRTVKGFRERPLETLKGLLDLSNVVADHAERLAYKAGREAGAKIVKLLEEPWENERKNETPEFLKRPLGWIQAQGEKLEAKVINTPWSKIGNKAGYVVGFLAIQIILLVGTDGIGNAIIEVGGAIGKLSKGAGVLARGLEGIATFVKGIGTAIAAVEHAIGLVTKAALKPLEPLLEPLGRFLSKLRGFLRKLLGLSEEAAGTATTKAATEVGAGLERTAHPPAGNVKTTPPPGFEPTAHPSVGDVTPRRPRGFDTGRAKPGRNVKPGTLEGLEPTQHPPAKRPRKKGPTRQQQLEGISFKKESQLARDEFNKVRDGYAKRLGVQKGEDVHHAIELNVLDRYPGVYTEKELNAFGNMRGIQSELQGRKQLHNAKIREMWDRHYQKLDAEIAQRGLTPNTQAYNDYVKRYLESARDEIDHVLGQFFKEYRSGLPRSFK